MHNQRIYTYLMARYCSRNRSLVRHVQGLPPVTEQESRENQRIVERVLSGVFRDEVEDFVYAA